MAGRHSQPASPNKPCRVTMTGVHQFVTFKKETKKRTRYWVSCWICGARK